MRLSTIVTTTVVIVAAGMLAIFGIRYFKGDWRPWKETDIDARTPNLSSSNLSPDGSQLVTLNTDEQIDSQGGASYRSQLVIRSVQSSHIVAALPLPDAHTGPIPFHTWQGGGVPFCNHGKYLLAFDRGDSVHVIDTQTWQDRLPLHPFRNLASADTFGANNMYFACSANAPIAIFELVSRSQTLNTRTTRTYDLDSGKQLSGTTEEEYADNLTSVAVSPAGSNAALVLQHHNTGTGSSETTELVIIDPENGQESKRIHIDNFSSQIAFAGESAIAVASYPIELVSSKIQLWDIRKGEPTETYADPETGASTTVAVSADGRVLMAYTGKENNCESCPADYHGTLQIEDARFTLWDRTSAKRIAQSPKLKVITTAAKFLDIDPRHPKESQRLSIQLSQSGNAVLVSRPGWNDPLQVFTLR